MTQLAFAALPLLFFGVSSVRAQDELPQGKGVATVQKVCTACHDLGPISALTGNKDIWQSVVDDMKVRGADASDAEFTEIVSYLSKYLGPSVNVNTAAAKELSDQLELTGAEADAIVKYRTDKGNFKEWADLQKVSGVDMSKLEPLKKRIKFN